jgi:hypothetical protein
MTSPRPKSSPLGIAVTINLTDGFVYCEIQFYLIKGLNISVFEFDKEKEKQRKSF